MNAALAANTDHALEEIAPALGRIEAGTYGVCENCGVSIAPARLAAIPAARLRVNCQESLSARN